MNIRSRLFATVAFPLISVSLAVQPALADSLMKPFEVAQESGDPAIDQPAAEGEVAPEELLRKKRKKREAQAAEEQPAAEEQQAAPAAEEQQPAAEEQAEPAEKPRKKREKKAAAEEQPVAEEQVAPVAEEQQPAAEQQAEPVEKPRKKRDKKAVAEEQQPAAEEQAAPVAEEQQPEAEQQAEPVEKPRKKRDKKAAAEEQQPTAEEQAAPVAEEAQPDAEQQAEPVEKPRKKRDKQKAAEEEQQQEEQKAADETQPEDEPVADKPVPEVTDTRTEEQKQEIAKDPSASDETVVLPVENGAAVLDSDKDADNAGGDQSREKRRKQREELRAEDENVETPKSDAESQAGRKERRPSREEIGAANSEKGERISEAPTFDLPDLIDAITGNNDGNTRRDRRPRVEEELDNRVVIDLGDQIIVRSDDRPRLRRNAEETFYEELPRGRTRETIEKPGGVKIVTVYNRYGDILQRTRIDRQGREYLLIYAPEADDGPRPPAYDVGDDLPPMRLRVPVRDYIIDTSSQPDRDYYDFLAEPPVEQVERVYTIDEVKNSARIRDKVRRIDLDTITFATGSAEVPMSQAKTLRSVANAMSEVLEKDPGETFFIEGHTDAVGSDQSNLVLSDQRAESVAVLLSEVYDIPAENLVTQGYGERFLKVRTGEAEQLNRRVTIRRVTALVRPVAQN
jgi:outer membrane protein OmpA-like peptidoglycan-associated protein